MTRTRSPWPSWTLTCEPCCGQLGSLGRLAAYPLVESAVVCRTVCADPRCNCCCRVHKEQQKKKETKKKVPAGQLCRPPRNLGVSWAGSSNSRVGRQWCALPPATNVAVLQHALNAHEASNTRLGSLVSRMGTAGAPRRPGDCTSFCCPAVVKLMICWLRLTPLCAVCIALTSQQVRVVQRNLVYAVGMPLQMCREEVSCAASGGPG